MADNTDNLILEDIITIKELSAYHNNIKKLLETAGREELDNAYITMRAFVDSNEINDTWGLIYETLGKSKDCLLDEDEFLSAYLTLLREPADYAFSESMAETKVFQMFCNRASQYDLSMARQHDASKKEPVVDDKKIRSFVIGIASFVGHWYDVYFPDLNTQRGLHIKKIQYLNGSKEMRIFLAQLLMMKDALMVDKCLEMTEKVLFKNALPGVSLLDERRFATRARVTDALC